MNYKTPKAIEKAVLDNTLMLFELEDMALKDPSLISEKAWQDAYKEDISLRIKQALGGFNLSAKSEKGIFSTSIDCLVRAEQRLIEAKDKGYDIAEEKSYDYEIGEVKGCDTTPSVFYDAIAKIVDTVKDNFTGSKELLSYLSACKLEVEGYRQELQSRLPALAQKYANSILRRSHRTARRLDVSYKTGKSFVGKLQNDFTELKKLQEYGIDETDRIEEIRTLAYEKGVISILDQSRDYALKDIGKSKKLLEKASSNASGLGRDISDMVRGIEALYSSQ